MCISDRDFRYPIAKSGIYAEKLKRTSYTYSLRVYFIRFIEYSKVNFAVDPRCEYVYLRDILYDSWFFTRGAYWPDSQVKQQNDMDRTLAKCERAIELELNMD